jgi:REP element-mobilizing transposase RayT
MKPACYAAAIEENHVHLLLSPVEEDLDRYVGRLKGRSSSVLKGLPQNASRRHHWTARFWRVFLYDSEALHAVRQYIIEHNLRRGLPADPFPFVSRLGAR